MKYQLIESDPKYRKPRAKKKLRIRFKPKLSRAKTIWLYIKKLRITWK